LFVVVGCSDDEKVDPSTIFGPSGAAGSFCASYCDGLVDSAAGCEHYNDGSRCEEICKFYVRGACQTTWEAFAACMEESQTAECFQPDAGKVTLVISDCHAEYDAWTKCSEERDAGVCPY
jgi:hypothetical protein